MDALKGTQDTISAGTEEHMAEAVRTVTKDVDRDHVSSTALFYWIALGGVVLFGGIQAVALAGRSLTVDEPFPRTW